MALQQQTLDPMRRGDSYTFEATVTQADGAPVDLTIYAIRSTGKYALADPDSEAIYQVTKADGDITVVGANNNIARVVIPAAATAGFTTNVTFWWDVQIAAGDLVYTVALGTLSAFLDVSQTAP